MYKEIYRSKVLELFFIDPDVKLHIREIARQTKIHPNTVLKITNNLAKENLLIITKTKAIKEVKVNKETELFYTIKKIQNLANLYFSGIIDFLYKEYNAPEAIILFGSYSRGEDTKKSDIDIAIITNMELKLNLKDFEKKLKRNIQLHEIDLKKVGKNFITTLINGTIIKGYLNL